MAGSPVEVPGSSGPPEVEPVLLSSVGSGSPVVLDSTPSLPPSAAPVVLAVACDGAPGAGSGASVSASASPVDPGAELCMGSAWPP